MIPWTFVIWTFKQFDFCFLFINCPHLKNFVCSLARFFRSSLEFTTTKTSESTRDGSMQTSTFPGMPSTYLLVFFLKSHALTASQPLHQTHLRGRDINTSHHFLSLSCSRLPHDGSTESNTLPLPKVSCHPFYLHAKWITNQQPPRRHTLRVRPSIFSTTPSSF